MKTAKDTASYRYDVLDRLVHEHETHGSATKASDFSYIGITRNVSKETIDNSQSDVGKPTPGDTVKTYSYDAFDRLISMKNAPTQETPEAARPATTALRVIDDMTGRFAWALLYFC